MEKWGKKKKAQRESAKEKSAESKTRREIILNIFNRENVKLSEHEKNLLALENICLLTILPSKKSVNFLSSFLRL